MNSVQKINSGKKMHPERKEFTSPVFDMQGNIRVTRYWRAKYLFMLYHIYSYISGQETIRNKWINGRKG